jgi:hypothetical protein
MYQYVLNGYGIGAHEAFMFTTFSVTDQHPLPISIKGFVTVDEVTRGPAESAFQAVMVLRGELDWHKPVLFLDCDSYAAVDIRDHIANCINLDGEDYDAAVGVFENHSDKSHFSSVKVTNGLRVLGMRERTVERPRWSSAGVYWFRNPYVLIQHAAAVINERPDVEIFMSDVINSVTYTGINDVLAVPIHHSHYHCLGTPEELEAYLESK